MGRVLAVKAVYLDAEGFEEQLRAVDQIVAIHNFDQVRNALQALVPVFDRFYADANRRERVQEKVLASWTKMPHQVRLELALGLAGVALEHGDRDNARALVDEGKTVVDSFTSTAETWIPHASVRSSMMRLSTALIFSRSERSSSSSTSPSTDRSVVCASWLVA